MTVFAGIAAAVLLPWLAGFLLLYRALKLGRLEALFLGYGAGTALLTFWMFCLGWLRIPFSTLSASALPVVVIAACMLAPPAKGRRSDKVEWNHAGLTPLRTVVAAILGAWILARGAFVFYECFNRPIYSWDAWANWSAGAKLFFYSRGMLLEAAENFFGAGYRPFLGHPVHTVLLQVWHSLWLGEFHEVFAKSWSFFYYASLLGLFFTAIKREFSWYPDLVALFFLSSMPLLTYHGQDAYADLPLSYFAFAAIYCFWRYIGERQAKHLALSGAFAAAGVLVKNEGVFFVLALIVALVIFERAEKGRTWRSLAVFLIPALALVGPWLAFKLMHGFGYGHTGASSGFQWLSDPKFGPEAQKAVRWEVVPAALSELFLKPNFALAMAFWAAATAVYFKTLAASRVKYLYPVPVCVISFFMFVYATLEPTAVLESTGVNRNALAYIPVVFFISAMLACAAVCKKPVKNN